MRLTTWAWVAPGAFLAAALLAGCGGGGGGGGSSSGGSGGGGGSTTPGQVALAATPGHGFVTLRWTQSNAAASPSYTIQREVGNGNGQPANGASPQPLPNTSGSITTSVSNGTTTYTYQDASYANGTNGISFPIVGSQYLYQVTPTTGTASSLVAAIPFGPPVGINFDGDTSTTAAPAPFANSSAGSGVFYTYTLPASGSPVIMMRFVFDSSYGTPTTADINNITIDVTGGTQTPDPNAVTYSHAQIQQGLSVNSNGHEIDFNSANITTNPLSIPRQVPYGLVLLNSQVYSVNNNTASTPETFQFCYYLPAVGSSQVQPEPGLNYASEFSYTLTNQ